MEILMTNFNTELITALSQGINIDKIFRKQLEEAMNLLLETERTAFIGYCHMMKYLFKEYGAPTTLYSDRHTIFHNKNIHRTLHSLTENVF